MLFLHAGGQEVSREELETIPTPSGSDSWHPIPHAQVLDSVCRTLSMANYEIKNQQLAVSKEGARFFATLDLTTTIGETESLTIGIRNSHDKSFSIGFCCGTRTFVCDNLAFRADIVIAKKHTRFGNDRYREGLGNAIAKLAQFADQQKLFIDDLKGSFVSKQEAESLILRAGETGIIGWHSVPKVLAEYREPSHEEHHDLTRYSLLQAFTQVLKPRFQSQPLKAAYETIELTNFLAV